MKSLKKTQEGPKEISRKETQKGREIAEEMPGEISEEIPGRILDGNPGDMCKEIAKGIS